jgi:hypothetical protein
VGGGEEVSGNFFSHFRSDATEFYPEVNEPKLSYKQWKTFQLSDHLPLWIEFKVDFSEHYLNKLKTEEYEE